MLDARDRHRILLRSLTSGFLGLALCAGGALAQSSSSATDLSQLIVSPDALGEGWSLASQGPDNALSGFSSKPAAAYGALYQQAPMTASLALYRYADRATALASPGFSEPSIYWGHGNTTFEDLSGYGDGLAYRAYPPGKGEISGITFVHGPVVVFVSVDGFDTKDDADALANQLASAEDGLLQSTLGGDGPVAATLRQARPISAS